METALMKKYQEYIEKLEASGTNMLEFKTPCCGNTLKTIAPEKNDFDVMWDSFTVCPICLGCFFKETYCDRVEVFRVNHPSSKLKTA